MDKKLFFITGRGRSGTWLLKSILDSHPKISVAPESIFILQMYSKYGKIKDWGNSRINAFVEDLSKDQKISGWWNIKFSELQHFIIQRNPESYKEVCQSVYEYYAKIHNKDNVHVVGDKNPEYSLKLLNLSKIFPESVYIILTRDPRDNISSYMNVNFDLNNPYSLAARWNFFHKKIFYAQSKLKDKVLLVRYEDLIIDPENTLKKICEKTGIDFDSQILEFYKNPKNVFRWNSKIQQKISLDNVYKWKNLKSQTVNRKITKLCLDYIHRLDYEDCEDINISFIEMLQYYKGYFVSYLELLFYLLPLNLTQLILSFYRKKNKTFFGL